MSARAGGNSGSGAVASADAENVSDGRRQGSPSDLLHFQRLAVGDGSTVRR